MCSSDLSLSDTSSLEEDSKQHVENGHFVQTQLLKCVRANHPSNQLSPTTLMAGQVTSLWSASSPLLQQLQLNLLQQLSTFSPGNCQHPEIESTLRFPAAAVQQYSAGAGSIGIGMDLNGLPGTGPMMVIPPALNNYRKSRSIVNPVLTCPLTLLPT